MDNLDEVVANYDVVLCSPVIETGVSINIKNHFDSVWAIAYGIQTVDAVCQSLERLRTDCDRHIWVKATAKNNRIGNGSTSIRSLLLSQHQPTKANISLLQRANLFDFEGELDVNYSPESLKAWAKRACVINDGKTDYRKAVIEKLTEEGYHLQEQAKDETEEPAVVNCLLKETRDINYQEHCEKITLSESPTDSELENLKRKRNLTEEERLKKRKGQLEKSYGVEVTPKLVQRDDKGWYSKLQLHYYLTVGNKYLAHRDKNSLSALKKQGQDRIFKPDLNRSQKLCIIESLKILEIEQFLDPDSEFSANSLEDWFENIIRFRFEIKQLLGVTINPERDSAIAVAQRILKKLGLKLEFKYFRGDRLSKQRIYGGCNLNPDGRSVIFDLWLKRDQKLYQVNPVLTLS